MRLIEKIPFKRIKIKKGDNMKVFLTITIIIFSITSVYAQNDDNSRVGVGPILSIPLAGVSVKYCSPYKVSYAAMIGLVEGLKGYGGRVAYNWSFGESDTEYIYRAIHMTPPLMKLVFRTSVEKFVRFVE